jgi:hypothetical protein
MKAVKTNTLALLLVLLASALPASQILVTGEGRRIRVQEVGTIRDGLTLFYTPGGMVLALKRDEIDLEATRTANEPKPATAAPSAESGTEEPTRPVSLTIRQAPVVDILRFLADQADLNLVVHPKVTGTLTLELDRVPWRRVLEMVTRPAGLGYELRGNVLYVAPVSAFQQEARDAQALRDARVLR